MRAALAHPLRDYWPEVIDGDADQRKRALTNLGATAEMTENGGFLAPDLGERTSADFYRYRMRRGNM